MKELLKQGSTVILLGPGGVGKTTVAAALGIAAARARLDTGMITVDPARRLRDDFALDDAHAVAIVLRFMQRVEALERQLRELKARG